MQTIAERLLTVLACGHGDPPRSQNTGELAQVLMKDDERHPAPLQMLVWNTTVCIRPLGVELGGVMAGMVCFSFTFDPGGAFAQGAQLLGAQGQALTTFQQSHGQGHQTHGHHTCTHDANDVVEDQPELETSEIYIKQRPDHQLSDQNWPHEATIVRPVVLFIAGHPHFHQKQLGLFISLPSMPLQGSTSSRETQQKHRTTTKT